MRHRADVDVVGTGDQKDQKDQDRLELFVESSLRDMTLEPGEVFHGNLVSQPREGEDLDLGTIPDSEHTSAVMISDMGKLAGFRRGAATAYSQVVANDPQVIRTLVRLIDYQLECGFLPVVDQAGEVYRQDVSQELTQAERQELRNSSIFHYLGQMRRANNPFDFDEVLATVKQEAEDTDQVSLVPYHQKGDYIAEANSQDVKVAGNMSPALATHLDRMGKKTALRREIQDHAHTDWGWDLTAIYDRVVARENNQPMSDMEKTRLVERVLQLVAKSKDKDWDSFYGNEHMDRHFGGAPVLFEQLDNSAGGFFSQPIYQDTDGFLYCVKKQDDGSREKVFFVDEKQIKRGGSFERNQTLSAEGYVDYLNELPGEVDVAEHLKVFGLPQFSYGYSITIDSNGQEQIDIFGPRLNLVDAQGNYFGVCFGGTKVRVGDRIVDLLDFDLQRCKKLVQHFAEEEAALMKSGFSGEEIFYHAAFDFDMTAVDIPSAERERRILESNLKRHHGLEKLDDNHYAAIIPVEKNARLDATTHTMAFFQKLDRDHGTNIAEDVLKGRRVVIQTDHKILGQRVLSQIARPAGSTDSGPEILDARKLIKLLKDNGNPILSLPSVLAKEPVSEKGFFITNSPVGHEAGIAVITDNEDEAHALFRLLDQFLNPTEVQDN